VLFFALYLSEGAPIGFLWLALPTRMREAGIGLADITALTAMLVLPWTLKFLWAPALDVVQSRRWNLRHWILAAQSLMVATLVPLAWFDLAEHFHLIRALLLAHAVAAATQDVAIDALCIRVTAPEERGRLNGWMQAGMLAGRAAMGGGALLLGTLLGHQRVVWLLVAITGFSMALLVGSRPGERGAPTQPGPIATTLRKAVARPGTWAALALALLGGAAFKSLEVIVGPFLIDRGYSAAEVGTITAGPMILAMMLGAVAGGRAADRFGHARTAATALVFLVACIAAMAVVDAGAGHAGNGLHLPVLLTATAAGIGAFTTSSYALFMDLADPAAAATMFSAFMGATNGCEAWSGWAIGRIAESRGYPTGMLTMCLVSLVSLPLLAVANNYARKARKPGDRAAAGG
jgi:PAT family beta-lactamase induction signal transducer AmpG